MTILNGIDPAPLAGWVIAQSNGLTLIGKHVGTKLTPVFEMKPQLAQGRAEGFAQPMHFCFPLWLMSITEIELPEGAIIVPVESLGKMERLQLHKFVEAAGNMLEQMRAAAAGIVTARTMPPAPGPVKG